MKKKKEREGEKSEKLIKLLTYSCLGFPNGSVVKNPPPSPLLYSYGDMNAL